MNPLTWDWIAGFYQAEGSVTGSVSAYHPQLLVCVKDAEAVELLDSFWHEMFPNITTYKPSYMHHTTLGDSTSIHLQIHAYKNILPVIAQIYPRTLHNVRRNIEEWAKRFRITLPSDQQPLTWDFVAGFWEGDGYISKAESPGSIYFGFVQKEPEILESILTFIGKGNIRRFKPDLSDYAHDLRVFDGRSNNNEISTTMLRHVRTQTCRSKITEALKYDESERSKYKEKYHERSKKDWASKADLREYLKNHPEVVTKYRTQLQSST